MTGDPALNSLGKRLTWARTLAGLSLSQAARLLQIPRHTLVRLEADRQPADDTTLVRAAAVYDIRLTWLRSGEEADLPPTALDDSLVWQEVAAVRRALSRTGQEADE